ncbi:unnamed protein product [Medioppia subpectinata]|uniref:Uncharacterized protein n=1 Tax=Medioppia subpectinata TaxID=1979941 RepID=A0A7R9L3Q3_9ACAR|nr:unnamed protein product [Medioppia subpectinata]CAG2114991.1 unnamed protein product [Medioppia subpectinata]
MSYNCDEWDDPHPCRQGDNVLENNFSLINSFSFTIGTMMQQGSAVAPKLYITWCESAHNE